MHCICHPPAQTDSLEIPWGRACITLCNNSERAEQGARRERDGACIRLGAISRHIQQQHCSVATTRNAEGSKRAPLYKDIKYVEGAGSALDCLNVLSLFEARPPPPLSRPMESARALIIFQSLYHHHRKQPALSLSTLTPHSGSSSSSITTQPYPSHLLLPMPDLMLNN